jgi:tRNA threonylcarbamoyladenosine biosynthesis protein TsaB
MSIKLLALDTATEACSAAVLIDDEIIERYELAPRRHTDLILPMVEAVLAEAGLTTAQLDAIAFGRGPGAFTGVRIAASVVQGIAFAANLPVVPISTLAAIARDTMDQHGVSQVAVAIDARMGEVYWGSYGMGSEGIPTLWGEEWVCSPHSVTLPYAEGEWIGAGTGWKNHAEVLRDRLNITTWWGDCYPRAGDIAMLGVLAYRQGDIVNPEQALPIYLREAVAEKAYAYTPSV